MFLQSFFISWHRATCSILVEYLRSVLKDVEAFPKLGQNHDMKMSVCCMEKRKSHDQVYIAYYMFIVHVIITVYFIMNYFINIHEIYIIII